MGLVDLGTPGSFPAAAPLYTPGTQAGGDTISVTSYDASGNPLVVVDNGVTTTYTYNSDGTPHTQTRLGIIRTYVYSGGQLVSIS